MVLIRRRWQVHPPLVGAPPPARSAPGRSEDPACRGCGHAWVGQVVESGRSVAGALVHRFMRPEEAAGEDALVRASPLLRMVPVGGVTADRSEFRGARFEEDKTDQQVFREANRKLACDEHISPSRVPMAYWRGLISKPAPDDRSGRTTASGGRGPKRGRAGYCGHGSPIQSPNLPLTELAIFGAASL